MKTESLIVRSTLMRRTWAPLVLIGSLVSCGPSLELDQIRSQISVPPLNQLDRWLADKEAQVPHLKPGTAAGVVWADPSRQQKTKLALIYIHGYTATRGEIFPVADRIARELGANLYYTRLTGHGVGFDGHRGVTVADWVRDGLEAWQIGLTLGERVVVVATSTGGALTTWLTLGPAGLRPEATIFVSPNLSPKNPQSEVLLWPFREQLLSWIQGDSRSNPAKNELHARFWDLQHHSHSLIPMMDLVHMARTQDFKNWPTPVLVVYDPLDTVVDEAKTVQLFSQAKQAVLRPWQAAEGDDHHVLAGDALSPQGTEPMVREGAAFLKRALNLTF